MITYNIQQVEEESPQPTNSTSLLSTIDTGFETSTQETHQCCQQECSSNNREEKHLIQFVNNCCEHTCSTEQQLNENSILDSIDTGFSGNQTVIIECKKPQYKTILFQENFLKEFKTVSEKAKARTNLDVYSKEETNLLIKDITVNQVSKTEIQNMLKNLDYVGSKFRAHVNYEIPKNLFK